MFYFLTSRDFEILDVALGYLFEECADESMISDSQYLRKRLRDFSDSFRFRVDFSSVKPEDARSFILNFGSEWRKFVNDKN